MRSLVTKIPYLGLAICLLSFTSPVAFAEESKNFFSWNSSFIKKSEPNKNKGIPANPPKKKLKGIPSQTSKSPVSEELTDEEKKLIRSMSDQLNTQDTEEPLKNTVRPPSVRIPRAPRPFQIPQPPRVPQNPNHQYIRIPSPPTAFSSNSNDKPEAPAAPSK